MNQLQQLRTDNPALAFHIDTYLDAYKEQNQPDVSIRRWIELDIKREAALIHTALTAGFIDRTPAQVFLPTEIWNKCLALIHSLTEAP
jgi:hypothetical protein